MSSRWLTLEEAAAEIAEETEAVLLLAYAEIEAHFQEQAALQLALMQRDLDGETIH
jgi:hypothetical protein